MPDSRFFCTKQQEVFMILLLLAIRAAYYIGLYRLSEVEHSLRLAWSGRLHPLISEEAT